MSCMPVPRSTQAIPRAFRMFASELPQDEAASSRCPRRAAAACTSRKTGASCALRVEHQPGAGREPRGVEGLRAEEADLLADGQHDLEVAVRQAALAQQA